MKISIEDALQKGEMARKQGNFQYAEKIYRAILRARPNNSEASHNMGLLLLSMRRKSESLNFLRSAVVSNPSVDSYWSKYIHVLLMEKKFEEAKKVSEEAIKKSKNTGYFLLLFGISVSFSELNNARNAELSPDQINILLKMFNEGLYGPAERFARILTLLSPDHSFSWQVLGAIQKKKKLIEEAFNLNRRAHIISPNDVLTNFNLGNTQKELGLIKESEVSYSRAIALRPDFPECHNNLGVIRHRSRQLEKAIASLRRAMVLNPDYTEAHNNAGGVFKDLGQLEEAEWVLRKAQTIRPSYIETIINLSLVYHYMNKLDNAISILEQIAEEFKNIQSLRAKVFLAIYSFLDGDFDVCKKYTYQTSIIRNYNLHYLKNEVVYQSYLQKLLDWHDENQSNMIEYSDISTLYVIGESHALGSHKLRVEYAGEVFSCRSLLIIGCKQWHLGNGIENQYKKKFKGLIYSIPKKSTVLLSIGEIDCRIDGGILKYYEGSMNERKLENIIRSTVIDYFSYINNINLDREYRIIIQGVPCPNMSLLDVPSDRAPILIDTVKMFNAEVKKQCERNGFGFLNVQKMTDNGVGISNMKWHIDDTHLSPSGMLEAWSKYLEEHTLSEVRGHQA